MSTADVNFDAKWSVFYSIFIIAKEKAVRNTRKLLKITLIDVKEQNSPSHAKIYGIFW